MKSSKPMANNASRSSSKALPVTAMSFLSSPPGLALDLPGRSPTTHHRHPDIHQDELRLPFKPALDRLLAILSLPDLKPGLSEQLNQPAPVVGIILNHQQPIDWLAGGQAGHPVA